MMTGAVACSRPWRASGAWASISTHDPSPPRPDLEPAPQELPREPYWPVSERKQRSLTLGGAAYRTESAPSEEVPTKEADPGEDDVYRKVADVVAKVSSYPRAAVRPDLSLVDDLGFDSLMVGDLATGLAEAFPSLGGLPQELLLNRPTVQAIVGSRGHRWHWCAADQRRRPAHRPTGRCGVWLHCPMTERPYAPSRIGSILLDRRARDEEVTAALKGAGAKITRNRDAEVERDPARRPSTSQCHRPQSWPERSHVPILPQQP